ncbi:MAG: phenylalanine--tRNA ligase subunit beta, partial [Halobacteriota archaeon]|nr:phenylalanine--tRNA ligase subunit beta [Halobacteriota archaeon]
MPVITLNYRDLERLTGASREEILEKIPMIGADIERIEEDYVDIEFFPDRPDMFSVEGVARSMRGFLGLEGGLCSYPVEESDIRIDVEESVKSVRPFVVCAVVRGLNFEEEVIESLMGLQEDLHWGIGRNRKKVSIGVHDLSKIKPPFRYLAEDHGFSFVPLDYDTEMTMEEVLQKHPKGVKFAHILEGMEKYPVILDSRGELLSFPPIINGELTRVTQDTKDVFIDVTGLDLHYINIALNIVVTALA